jgi:hypothetical protein
MKALSIDEVCMVSGGAEPPNPIQLVGAGSTLGAGFAIATGASAAGAVTTTVGAVSAGATVIVLAGVGGYTVGDYIEQKTGWGAAAGNWVGSTWLGSKIFCW